MRKYITVILITVFVGVLATPFHSIAKNEASTTPILNNGKKWRIGYYEGGSYVNYPVNLRTVVDGLVELGWIEPVKIPEVSDGSDSKLVWNYLVQNAPSDYLEFVAGAYWSAQWSEEKRTLIKEEIIQRLNNQKDIDFMIAMGTWPGQDLSNDRHNTPTIAVSVSDPVRSGMSATAENSGLDHFHAKCDPNRYIRQLRLFHRLAKFNKLGIVYENTPEGRSYAALDDIYNVAKERNFSVITCEAPISQVGKDVMIKGVIQCHQKLAKQVDAVFVTVHPGVTKSHMKELIAPFLEYKIPSWSQRGPEEVKAGILFSIARGGFKAVGLYHAEVMARIFNGEKPGDINQIFEDPRLIAVNKKVAGMIEFDIPETILQITDETYDTIEN